VQLVKIRAEQTFFMSEGAKARTTEAGVTISAKAPSATERTSIIIEGRDYSSRPGEHVPALKQTLANYLYFEGNLQKTNKIQLISQTAPQAEGSRSFVGFGLQMFFQDKERRLYD
jgi:hypothetical protein